MDVMGDKVTLFDSGRFALAVDPVEIVDEARDETGAAADEVAELARRRLAAEAGDAEAMSVLGAMLLRR
ncbi:sel1 repeat family protein, partial [Streptomyces sp. SID10815]|nr:sel1 repeat family protein [Streptomyces sp. SID10815]